MKDNEIIQEATEAVEKNLNAGCYVEELLRIVKEQQAEIERLRNDRIVIELDDEVLLKDFKTEVKKEINTIKSEAYREFAERFKQKYDKPLFYLGSYEQFMCEVDNLVKELTESNE